MFDGESLWHRVVLQSRIEYLGDISNQLALVPLMFMAYLSHVVLV